MQTRALLALRLPAPPKQGNEWFKWYLEPPDDLEGCTWYLDGSMMDGEWLDFQAIGFGIVIVSRSGELLAHGSGGPPPWCNSAAAAEAWALFMALSLCPFPPCIRTDCLALLRTAEGGLVRAMAGHRPLARVWSQIGNALDGNLQALVEGGMLVWMPAHQGLAAVKNRVLSNGTELSTVDWRANRLVDALAKHAAAQRQAPMAIRRLLVSGRAAVRHAAALLGQVTHAATHCMMECTMPDGTVEWRACRDAQQPRFTRKRPRPAGDEDPAVPEPERPEVPAPEHPAAVAAPCERPLLPCSRQQERAAAARERAHLQRAEQEGHTRRRLTEIAAACKPAVGKLSGAERLEQVRRRVRAHIAEASMAGKRGESSDVRAF